MCTLYPDINCLSPDKIAKKLQDGKSHMQAGFSLALMTVARVLRHNVEEPIESLLTKLEQNCLIETTTKDRAVGRQDSVEEICWCMQNKCQSDLELFFKMLQENEALVSLVNFINDVIAKCKCTENGANGNGTEVIETTSRNSDIKLRLDVDPHCEDQYLACISNQKEEFQTRVIYTDTRITSVVQHCILITMEGLDEWDLENLRLDMASGAFKTRLVSWLRAEGINITDEEADSIKVGMEAQLMSGPPGARGSSGKEESPAAGEDRKEITAKGTDAGKDKETPLVTQEASGESSSHPAEDVTEDSSKSENTSGDAGGKDG